MTDPPSMTRMEALLATLVVQNMGSAPQAEKCVVLNRIGLNNGDIADVLDTTSAVVSQSLYEARKAKKSPAKKAAANKKTAKKQAPAKKQAAKKRASAKSSERSTSGSNRPTGSVLRGGGRA